MYSIKCADARMLLLQQACDKAAALQIVVHHCMRIVFPFHNALLKLRMHLL